MLAWLQSFFRKSNQPFGRRGENVAAKFLCKLGYQILAKNFVRPLGEIDLIARDGDTLVFVEVKTRAYDDPTPEEQVHSFKQHQLTKTARFYLGQLKEQPPARFDVVAIVWPAGGEPVVRHTLNAFEATF